MGPKRLNFNKQYNYVWQSIGGGYSVHDDNSEWIALLRG